MTVVFQIYTYQAKKINDDLVLLSPYINYNVINVCQ